MFNVMVGMLLGSCDVQGGEVVMLDREWRVFYLDMYYYGRYVLLLDQI
jgi:hypothetical protein